MKYILDDRGNPVAEPDTLKWAAWYEVPSRRFVAEDHIKGARISTTFLALDLGFGAQPLVLWETMVFGGPLNEKMDRCSGSKEQAEAMHARMVARVRAVAIES